MGERVRGVRVTDVAVADNAVELYGEVIELGENSGRTPIRAKDGTTYLLEYAAEGCDFAAALGGRGRGSRSRGSCPGTASGIPR